MTFVTNAAPLRFSPGDIARARAVDIATMLPAGHLARMHRAGATELKGPCPVCGGTDRFWINTRKQTWGCRHCPPIKPGSQHAGGDVIDLVVFLDGCDLPAAVRRLLGDGTGGVRRKEFRSPAQHAPAGAPSARPIERPRWMTAWAEAVRIVPGSLAWRYFTGPKEEGFRGIDLSSPLLPADLSPRVLRFHPAVYYGPDSGVPEGTYPSVLALYVDILTGEPKALHRTPLTADGRNIKRPDKNGRLKTCRSTLGDLRNTAIKLSDDADVSMGLTIGEGIETTLSGMLKGFAPAWALGSSVAIGAFPVLSGIETLTILGETGDGGANAKAVDACFERWDAAGREIIAVESTVGNDMNDAA